MQYLIVFLGLLVIGLMVTALFLYKKISLLLTEPKPQDDVLKLMNDNLQSITNNVVKQLSDNTKRVDERLSDVTRQVNDRLKENYQAIQNSGKNANERLDNAAKATHKMTSELTSRLSKLEEANKRIYDVGKDISSLQEILKSPKLRGNLGELFLGDLLSQVLPKDNYKLQYSFKSGDTVDAVIMIKDGLLIPVDSKFSLENFSKMINIKDEKEKEKVRKVFISDIKKRINEIAKKYILPDEGTLDFALMYIPAENVYYEVIIRDQHNDSVCDYALKNKVIPVSPNNFFVYLQTILLGLKGFQIEEKAMEIQKHLSRLNVDFSKFSGHFEVVGKHITNASNKYHESEKFLDRFTDKLQQVDITPREARKIESAKESSEVTEQLKI